MLKKTEKESSQSGFAGPKLYFLFQRRLNWQPRSESKNTSIQKKQKKPTRGFTQGEIKGLEIHSNDIHFDC